MTVWSVQCSTDNALPVCHAVGCTQGELVATVLDRRGELAAGAPSTLF